MSHLLAGHLCKGKILVIHEVSNHLAVKEVTKRQRGVALTSGEKSKTVIFGKAALLSNIITIPLGDPVGQADPAE